MHDHPYIRFFYEAFDGLNYSQSLECRRSERNPVVARDNQHGASLFPRLSFSIILLYHEQHLYLFLHSTLSQRCIPLSHIREITPIKPTRARVLAG